MRGCLAACLVVATAVSVTGEEVSPAYNALLEGLNATFLVRLDVANKLSQQASEDTLDTIAVEQFLGRAATARSAKTLLSKSIVALNRWQWVVPAKWNYRDYKVGDVVILDKPTLSYTHRNGANMLAAIKFNITKQSTTSIGAEFQGGKLPDLTKPLVVIGVRTFEANYEAGNFRYRTGSKIPQMESLADVVKRLKLTRTKPSKPPQSE